MSENYIAINVDFLVILGGLPVAVYVRLSNNKFLKYLKKGELFQVREQKILQNKKVQKLYVEWCESKEFAIINSIRLGVDRILEKKSLIPEEKLILIHSQVQNLIHVREKGFHLSRLITEVVEDCLEEITKKLKFHDLWKFKKTPESYNSNLFIVQSFLILFILDDLKLKTKKKYRDLIMFVFFHSMTLSSKLLKIKTHNEFMVLKYLMGAEEISYFQEHALRTKKLTASLDVHLSIFRNGFFEEKGDAGNEVKSLQSCIFIFTQYLAKEILDSSDFQCMDRILRKFKEEGFNKDQFQPAFQSIDRWMKENFQEFYLCSS